MSFRKLPGDVLLNVARKVDDQTLLSVAKTWTPMLQVVRSGQSTTEETRLRLTESYFKEGPAGKKMRKQNPHEFLAKLDGYSLGWDHLQWSKQQLLGAFPGTGPSTQWADGSGPMGNVFMGESGGCIYSVRPTVPGRPESTVSIYVPPSERRKTKSLTFVYDLTFSIVGVAIDGSCGLFALIPRPDGCPLQVLVFGIANGRHIITHTTTDMLNWYPDMIVRQFEIVRDTLTFTLEYPICPSAIVFVFKWGNKKHQAVEPFKLDMDISYCGTQFIRTDLILITEQSQVDGLWGTRMRVVSLYNPRDMYNNILFEQPLLGRTREEPDWLVSRVTFIPYNGMIEGQEITADTPFYFDPTHRLIGVRYEYELPDGSTAQSVELFDLKKLLLWDISHPQELHMDNSCEGFVISGRRLIWTQRTDKGLVINAINFSPNALPSSSGYITHPEDQTWVTKTENRLFSNFGMAKHTRTRTERPGAYKSIITQDNIIFLMTGDHTGNPIMWDHTF